MTVDLKMGGLHYFIFQQRTFRQLLQKQLYYPDNLNLYFSIYVVEYHSNLQGIRIYLL